MSNWRYTHNCCFTTKIQNSYKKIGDAYWRVTLYLLILSSGNIGPYIMCKRRAVNAKQTRFHCSIKDNRWRHLRHDSLKVLHNGGDGKLRSHATSHTWVDENSRISKWESFLEKTKFSSYLRTSSSTPKTLSHNCSPVSSLIAGGAKRASLIPIKNKSKLCHVSLSKVAELLATCCNVRKTLWHNTACLLIVSAPTIYQRSRLVDGKSLRLQHA